MAVAAGDAVRGPYTDHGPMVCQDAGSIDAVPIADEKGAALSRVEGGRQQPQAADAALGAAALDDGTTLIGEPREILRNEASWEAHLIEGPFIQRRDGWFYLFYSADACCGRRCNYKLGVARSRALLGPWERHPEESDPRGERHWKCPGHGSVVAAP